MVDANDSSTFMTGILRPGGIYGPRDRHVVRAVSTHAVAGPGFVLHTEDVEGGLQM